MFLYDLAGDTRDRTAHSGWPHDSPDFDLVRLGEKQPWESCELEMMIEK
jgi:hypothetical protein